jgi:hypothetical protein
VRGRRIRRRTPPWPRTSSSRLRTRSRRKPLSAPRTATLPAADRRAAAAGARLRPVAGLRPQAGLHPLAPPPQGARRRAAGAHRQVEAPPPLRHQPDRQVERRAEPRARRRRLPLRLERHPPQVRARRLPAPRRLAQLAQHHRRLVLRQRHRRRPNKLNRRSLLSPCRAPRIGSPCG